MNGAIYDISAHLHTGFMNWFAESRPTIGSLLDKAIESEADAIVFDSKHAKHSDNTMLILLIALKHAASKQQFEMLLTQAFGLMYDEMRVADTDASNEERL